jgi:hypothetical protein
MTVLRQIHNRLRTAVTQQSPAEKIHCYYHNGVKTLPVKAKKSLRAQKVAAITGFDLWLVSLDN